MTQKPLVRIGPAVQVSLEVRRPDGSVRTQWCGDPNDLATDNWMKLFRALVSPRGTTLVSETLTDTASASNTHNVWSAGSGSPYNFTWSSTGPTVSIALGDGGGSAVTPARGDVALVNQLHSGQASNGARGGGTVTISASFVNSTGATQTIREAGLVWKIADTNNAAKNVLMFHDATAATDVLAGETVTATYTFTWP